jgi:pimeloyl-ACP methyl ester carboxylesterase
VRGEFLDLSGARLSYYAAGTRGAGEPVLFLHGFPTSGHLWADVIRSMPPGHRIVVLDLLGYGRSDRPLRRPVDIAAHAERVVQVLDELRIERACIVGHGLGGGIAQSLAVYHPDRVSRLCLINSVAFDDWPAIEVRVGRATLPLTRWLPSELIRGVVRRQLQRGYADPARAARSLDLYLRPFAGVDGRDALIAHIRALTSSQTAEVGARLGEVAVPTAIVWGEADGVTPLASGKKLRAAIRGATLDVLAEGRHFVPEESPRPVAEAIASLLRR